MVKDLTSAESIYNVFNSIHIYAIYSFYTLQYPGSLFLIAGLRTGTGGARSSSVYKSQAGLLCDMNGVACSYR